MNTTTTRKVRALVDFRPTKYRSDGHVEHYLGQIVSPNSGLIIDQQTGSTSPRYICRIDRIDPRDGSEVQYRLLTQGAHKGSRRYRTGTFAEMIEVAEKWVARRFYSEPF